MSAYTVTMTVLQFKYSVKVWVGKERKTLHLFLQYSLNNHTEKPKVANLEVEDGKKV